MYIADCAANTLFAGDNASFVVLIKPNAKASFLSVASLSKIPYLLIGSASPRNAAPIAWIASSGEVLLNEAKSDASFTKPIENLDKSLPVNPAALPSVAKVDAAATACLRD